MKMSLSVTALASGLAFALTAPAALASQPPVQQTSQQAGQQSVHQLGRSVSAQTARGETTTSLTLRATTKGRRVVARVKLSATTDAETRPIVEQRVVVQKKVGSKWKTLRRLTTSGRGTAKARFTVAKQTRIRARYAGSGEVVVGGSSPTPAATSQVLRVG